MGFEIVEILLNYLSNY